MDEADWHLAVPEQQEYNMGYATGKIGVPHVL